MKKYLAIFVSVCMLAACSTSPKIARNVEDYKCIGNQAELNKDMWKKYKRRVFNGCKAIHSDGTKPSLPTYLTSTNKKLYIEIDARNRLRNYIIKEAREHKNKDAISNLTDSDILKIFSVTLDYVDNKDKLKFVPNKKNYGMDLRLAENPPKGTYVIYLKSNTHVEPITLKSGETVPEYTGSYLDKTPTLLIVVQLTYIFFIEMY